MDIGSKTNDLRSCLERGVKLFNGGRFFEAHEAWEDAWRAETDTTTRSFLQGLIQVAAGFVKWQRGQPRGMAALLERGADKLRRGPPGAFGLNLDELLESVDRFKAVAASMIEGSPQGSIRPDPPQLTLGPDPRTG